MCCCVIAAPTTRPLHRYVRPRLVLVGDAAHVTHPLAGQGVNLGFADVMQLVATLAHAAESGQDPGSMQLLQVWKLKRVLLHRHMLYSLAAHLVVDANRKCTRHPGCGPIWPWAPRWTCSSGCLRCKRG